MIYIVVVLQTYPRFIKGNALVHLLSPVDASLRISASFDLALYRAAPIGVGWWGGFSSHKVYPPSGVSGICPLVDFFCFIMCVVQNLGSSTKYWGIRSVLGSSASTFCVQHFQRRLQISQKNWCQFTRELAFISSYLLVVICCCHWVVEVAQPLFSVGILAGFLSFISLCNRIYKVLWWTDSRLQKCPRKSSPCLLFLLFCNEDCFDGLYSILSNRIYCVAVFTLVL